MPSAGSIKSKDEERMLEKEEIRWNEYIAERFQEQEI